MKYVLSIILIFVLIIFQSSLYPYLQMYNAFPNLILILVIVLSILRGYRKSLIWIIAGGLFLDIFSFNNPLGISIVILFLVGYLVHFLSQNIFKKAGVLFVILSGIGATLIYNLCLTLVLLIIGIGFQLTLAQIISQIIYNLVILVPLFYLIKKLSHA